MADHRGRRLPARGRARHGRGPGAPAAQHRSEALHLNVNDCELPEEGWGSLRLTGSTQHVGEGWGDDSTAIREDRELKHRPKNATIQVAEWAGHSVNVLLKVYAKCIEGQDEAARRRIAKALGEPAEGAADQD